MTAGPAARRISSSARSLRDSSSSLVLRLQYRTTCHPRDVRVLASVPKRNSMARRSRASGPKLVLSERKRVEGRLVHTPSGDTSFDIANAGLALQKAPPLRPSTTAAPVLSERSSSFDYGAARLRSG